MPIDEFIELLNDEIDGKIRAATLGFSQTGRMVLGGVTGPDGGSGGPPGGFIGQLAQKYVTYDTTEALASGGAASLVDNLNHMRYDTGVNVEDLAVVSGFVQQNITEIAVNVLDIAINAANIFTISGAVASGIAGIDLDAIHDNVNNEINLIGNKSAPVDDDILIIEDSEDSFAKKKIYISTISGVGGDPIIAGDGLLKAGNTLSVYVDDTSIKILDDYLYVYAIDGGSF